MKIFNKFVIFLILLLQVTNSFAGAKNQTDEEKVWLKEALYYGFNMHTVDYTKYMSQNYVEYIDGKTFNFQQWIHHMNGLKNLMQSYTLSFDDMLVEGNKIAASYKVHAIKKDGTSLNIKIIAIFTIKDQKIVSCDELTHLIEGPVQYKELANQN